MSLGLVAYGSSDEGEESEEDIPTPTGDAVAHTPTVQQKEINEGPHISDDDDEFFGSTPISHGLKLPPPKATPNVLNEELGNQQSRSDLSSTAGSLLPGKCSSFYDIRRNK